jgi:hypothetical protein
MPDQETVSRFIRAAMTYMVRSCGPDGRFLYRMNLDPAVSVTPGYNMLRHAGAMYALGLYLEQAPSPEAADALLRASGFLISQVAEPSGWDETLAVWSGPEVEGRSGVGPMAKLGGTGLGLVGLSYAERVAPGSSPIEGLRALGRFLIRMQRPDGCFASIYDPAIGGPRSDWVSLYYPGEAALGLLCLFELDPDPAWLDSATRALAYLARSRQGRVRVEPDHWAILATARWQAMAGEGMEPSVRSAILGHAEQVARSMIAEIPPWPAGSPLEGCSVGDGRTCPTATRLEGLIAALECLPDGPGGLDAEIRRHVGAGLGFLSRYQVTEGPAWGGLPRAAGRFPLVCRAAAGRFNDRATEIRIDYVQHAVSAFLAWRRLGLSASRSAA